MAETKKVRMGERIYQGVEWPDVLRDGGEYELPVELADRLIAGGFAQEIKPKPKPKTSK